MTVFHVFGHCFTVASNQQIKSNIGAKKNKKKKTTSPSAAVTFDLFAAG